jgi:hypothetical protein
MIKLICGFQNYLLFTLPLVIICMLWGTFSPEQHILQDANIITKVSWELLSWNLMAWFTVLISFLVILVTVSSAREVTLKRLANVKDRDEREQHITGEASRVAYISSLSLLILFLFLSIFNLNIYRAPQSEAINGKTGTVNIGLHFDLLDRPNVVKTSPVGEILFESKDIPLSKTGIILILLGWQLLAFYLSARKLDHEI